MNPVHHAKKREHGHPRVQPARLAGLSPIESLQVVTRNPARLMGLDSDVGTVSPGKKADLLFEVIRLQGTSAKQNNVTLQEGKVAP